MPSIPTPISRTPEGSNLEINTYDIASLIPSTVLTTLRQNSIRTNVVLPLIEKAVLNDLGEESFDDEDLWITCSSVDLEGNSTLDLVLSCTRSEMGKYPIFIVATVPFSQLTFQFLAPRVYNLVLALERAVISLRRVYSIFAPDIIAHLFAEYWTECTGVAVHDENPYYSAMLSSCTRESFRNRQETRAHEGVRYNLRPARYSDLRAVAELCYGFAAESKPFVLDEAGASKEAQILIRNEQVWVHETQSGDKFQPQIACLVAYTRNTPTTATITKVMTSPSHRGKGCAQRLVRQVCKHLLYNGKHSVALYVAHNNKPASRVYHNVGFVGLRPTNDIPIEGVERWSEIGFDQSKVELGHW
ncbi:acyl-CoA N-acyltransferase [Lentinula aciculospora]|uniref:Acyl-CoA N-acyltransferase n=1 Tax=Lentinula aciculospora TaxID=153920 RepID=A0A9W9DHE7_9AGAR|nr:acyl-CoA N-acyltransferase [Lentinula aciculospora]